MKMASEKDKANLQEELQRVLVELETYRKQLEALEREDQILESSWSELTTTQKALDSIKETKAGKEVLVPLGSGSYVRGELKETQKVLIGVGSGISLEKRVGEAKKTLKEREEILNNSRKRVQDKVKELTNKIAELSPQAEKLLQKTRGE